MWYEDLSQCDYFGEELSETLTAIGWLENDKPFSKGKISQDFYDKLCELSKNPWTFSMFCGIHECNLCQFEGKAGLNNIFIPHNNKIYICPELITHYINSHHYLPPNEFIEAVLACPPMRSMDYIKKMLENGGRKLVRFIKDS